MLLIVFVSHVFIRCIAQVQPDSQSAPILVPLEDSLHRAESLIADSDFKNAQIFLEAYLSLHPTSANAHFLLAYSLLRLDKPDASLAEYTRAAKLRIPSAVDLEHVAQDYVLLNDDTDAEKWMTRAVQMNERDANAWYGLGRIEYTRQKFALAITCFQRALELQPESVKAENNLGLAYEALYRISEAENAYRTALEWQKTSTHPSEQPMLNLASLLLDQGKLDEAESLLLKAIKIAPLDPKIHERLGHAYMQDGQFEKAQVEFERDVEISPNSGAFHYMLAQAYRREGLNGKAELEFKRAAELNGSKSTPSAK